MNDEITAQLLQNVLDSLKANRMHHSFDAGVMNVLDQARNIVDPAFRGPLERQCEDLLGLKT